MVKNKNSLNIFKETIKNIPLASQTFSKSYKFLPNKRSPLFIKKASGCYVTDVDGNQYIDMVNALLSVSIGYRVKKIDNAVINQIKKNGINFSLPSENENKLAKLLIKHIPCAEMVRYAKNGSDVTSAAIRLSRYYTKRKKIFFSGYHGWHDWYIGKTTFNHGVPHETSKLSFNFKFNDLKGFIKIFQKHRKDLAAVILEPMSIEKPRINFLRIIKKMCKENGTLLIFDETCTGFRFSLGGAQKLFKITPDLSTFGKGVANGYPLSILVGKKKIMKHCDNIFFSTTFGGENVSLIGAISTINYIIDKNVISHLYKMGKLLVISIKKVLDSNLINFVSIEGHPSWTFMIFKSVGKYKDSHIKTYFIEKCIENGILTLGTNNISYAHKKKDILKVIKVYEKILIDINNKIKNKEILLKYKAIEPLFKVRV